MKLSPPGRDMTVWTLYFGVCGVLMLFVCILSLAPLTLVNGLCYVAGALGIWMGKAKAKWFIIIPAIVVILDRGYLLVAAPFAWLTLGTFIFTIFLVIRFWTWAPNKYLQKTTEPNQALEPTTTSGTPPAGQEARQP
jgi:hypothetical protein